jgi:deoxyribodipyrimidine photo-lyase
MKCPLKKACPIQNFPDEVNLPRLERLELLDRDPDLDRTTGPKEVIRKSTPTEVLITIDSMGDADPALSANPDLPVVFVFNREALRRLQLSSKRIHFYLETLQDLATRRDLKVYLGSPFEYAKNNSVALTFAPVPSFAKFSQVAELHPFPWLREPHDRNIQSFTAWRQRLVYLK